MKKKVNGRQMKKKVNGRQKGATAERKLAKLFSEWWRSEFTRTPLSGGFATKRFRDEFNAAGDLVTSDPSFPFCVESKKVEGWSLDQLLVSNKTKVHSWWQQTVGETPEGKIPILVFTKNRAPLFAMLKASDWLEMANGLKSVSNFLWKSPDFGDLVIFELKHLFSSDPSFWKD